MTGHETFANSVSATKAWLEKYRVFLTLGAESEIRANLPFEIRPAKNPRTGPTGKTKGILLVHGLGDSPGTFVDLAQEFAARGFLVRTVLLPGHGTRPAGDYVFRPRARPPRQQFLPHGSDVQNVQSILWGAGRLSHVPQQPARRSL
jgi:pimeloyl-ACP methyl ester carboxylesterase